MTYSQFEEDDIVDVLLGYPKDGIVVEIGAGDGKHLSNSLLFRERGWQAVLVEPDPIHFEALDGLSEPQTTIYKYPATTETMSWMVPEDTMILSIDVDGDDLFLFDALWSRPDVVIIEHNPTIPYHMDVSPARPGLQIGASVAALTRVAESKGYGLDYVTECNAIFRYGEKSLPIPKYRPNYSVATEYFTGRPFIVGESPWGVDFANPYPPGDVIIR